MSQWAQLNPSAWNENIFALLDNQWVLVAAQKEDAVNAMTASWGGFGILWNEQVATIYVRQSRYTRTFLDTADTFSLTVYDKSYQPMLNDVMGQKSGRDIDKIKHSGLTLSHLNKTPVFDQARLAFVCEKLYRHQMTEDEFCNRAYFDKYYTGGDFHTIYIAKIKAMYQK